MKTTWLFLTVLLSSATFAEITQPVEIPELSSALKPKHAVEFRRGAFEVIGWYFKQMGAMTKGELPFNKEAFLKGAKMISFMSDVPLEGFVKGTATKEERGSESKPEIWKNFADFKNKMNSFQKEAKTLAEVAQTGNEVEIKAQFATTTKTCKSCHDDYREKH
jgi:cytochrome c556